MTREVLQPRVGRRPTPRRKRTLAASPLWAQGSGPVRAGQRPVGSLLAVLACWAVWLCSPMTHCGYFSNRKSANEKGAQRNASHSEEALRQRRQAQVSSQYVYAGRSQSQSVHVSLCQSKSVYVLSSCRPAKTPLERC